MQQEDEMRHSLDNCDGEQNCPSIKNCIDGRQLLAHAYVPWQSYNKAYCPREALTKGTLFPELWGVYRIPK